MTSFQNVPLSRSNIATRITMGEVTNQLGGTRPRRRPQPVPAPPPPPLGFVAARRRGCRTRGAPPPPIAAAAGLYLYAMPPAPRPKSNAENGAERIPFRRRIWFSRVLILGRIRFHPPFIQKSAEQLVDFSAFPLSLSLTLALPLYINTRSSVLALCKESWEAPPGWWNR